jgi:hypothetical protein
MIPIATRIRIGNGIATRIMTGPDQAVRRLHVDGFPKGTEVPLSSFFLAKTYIPSQTHIWENEGGRE